MNKVILDDGAGIVGTIAACTLAALDEKLVGRDSVSHAGARGIVMRVMLFALVIAVALPARAAEKPMPPLTAVLVALIGDELYKPEVRRQAASNIAVYCRALSDKIPRLSPREDDWLDAELRSSRIGEAIKTPEFARRKLTLHAQRCESATSIILSEPNREMVGWSVLTGAIVDRDVGYYVRQLATRNIALSQADAEDADGLSGMAPYIVDKILTPHLALNALPKS